MTKIEIVISFFTIVYGLMLTDLFNSLHKLIRNRKIVKWHWLPLIASWYLFLQIINNWWGFLSFNESSGFNIVYFFILAHVVILFYLSVSVILPDEIQKKGVDLKEYYFQNHSYFWGLITAISIVSLLISIIPQFIHSSHLDTIHIVVRIAFILLSGLLVFSKKYWVHSSLLIVFVLINLLELSQKI